MCVCVCARVFVVSRQQLLGFNLVSFVNISVISSEFVSLSPHSLRPPPLPNVHMRLALCPYVSLALSLSLVQRDYSLHLTLCPPHLSPATFRREYADLAP